MSLRYSLVFFDVDSTLVTIEGIDVLAGNDPEVTALTEAAMAGRIPLNEVYGRRLDRIRPNRRAVEILASTYLRSLTPGAEETIARLRSERVDVHLVTGGIAQAVAPLAEHLGIPARAVHSVSLDFDQTDEYAGFDRRSPLTRPGGKETVVIDVRSRMKGKAAFVGDGMTDLDAAGVVDLFIGFGGVTVRDAVRERSGIYILELDLRAVLPHLLEDQP